MPFVQLIPPFIIKCCNRSYSSPIPLHNTPHQAVSTEEERQDFVPPPLVSRNSGPIWSKHR
ncbi:hypothetical protein SNOG_02415 [Parastagonospora nodorum SN15]|uniref:Uncharacterized protein n=1 Tax=Phaeosphaeria nodorum (strain SN15 / ATCC MYA-4574 / FGSC 10173) TaxID=321614 RepID=Q0V0P9_PHANO|nr:hypothetical protein SNOG_02415 [Parastagonospora nodorum SN15]EAT90627.1 hypothetical protein SNOG_02415 [Parastagonospora nodorum SN15]